MTTALVVLLAAAIGTSMGFSGIGGFLVVPLMMIVAGASATQAVFTALAANLAVTLGNGLFAIGRRQIDWRAFWLLLAGSVLGTLVGAWLVAVLPPTASRYVIALFLAGLGVTTLVSGRQTIASERPLPGLGAVALGIAAQVSAVLVGIGGPAVTVPVLSSRSRSADRVVGTGLLHGAFVSALGLWVTRQAGATIDGLVVLVPAIILVASLLASLWRRRMLAVVSIRPFVGVLALVGAGVLLFLR